MLVLIVKEGNVWGYTVTVYGEDLNCLENWFIQPLHGKLPSADRVKKLISLTGGWIPARPSSKLKKFMLAGGQ